MAANRDVVIVGGGVIGLSAAYYAAKKGHRVTLVERGAPDHDSCSLGNAGLIVPSHFVPLAAPGMVALGLRWMLSRRSPFYIQPRLSRSLARWAYGFWRSSTREHVARSAPLLRDLHLASRACFEELAALPGADFGFEKKGLLALCRTEAALREEAHTAEEARRLGLPAEVLDARATASLEPGVRMDVVGSVYYPKDCHLAPRLFVAWLTRACQDAGVRFEWRSEVVGWRTSGRRVAAACTSRAELGADEFVVCGGSWSPLVARGLGLRLPIEAGKGYSLTMPSPRKAPAISALLIEARVAVTPMAGALRFGGTMEIGGLNETIHPWRVEGIIQSAIRYLPDFTAADFQGIEPWRGLRPCTPDGLPFLGRSQRHDNLVIATGHAMLGLSLGPITGKLVAQLISGESPEIDLTLLRPERFD